jgi:ferredoxin
VQFCLFGVYDVDADGKVRVVNPEGCKTNCPACARICPRAAIIFPKAEEDPINGAEITDEEAVKANVKINLEEYLGENVYAALAVRKMKRRRLVEEKEA